jgi:hypothetical protein
MKRAELDILDILPDHYGWDSWLFSRMKWYWSSDLYSIMEILMLKDE